MPRQIPTLSDLPLHGWKPYSDFHRERVRAHEIHQNNSMEAMDWSSPRCRDIVLEELGEIARAFNEYELGNTTRRELILQVRKEINQLGAMVSAWADAIREYPA